MLDENGVFQYGLLVDSEAEAPKSAWHSSDDSGVALDLPLGEDGRNPSQDDFLSGTSMFSLSLLDREHEQALAHTMLGANKAIMTSLLYHEANCRAVVDFLSQLLHTPLKKRIFTTEQHYFALRRELDDLLLSNNSVQGMKHLLANIERASGKYEHDVIRDMVANVDWPGPLMFTLAGQFGDETPPTTRLSAAIHQFMNRGELSWQSPHHDEKQASELRAYRRDYLRARDTFINHNMRLVFHVAKRYAYKGEDLPELIQEGTFGLLRAAEKYRSTTGYRFSTYAHHWIDSKIRKARVNLDKLVHISPEVDREQTQLRQQVELHKQNGAHATPHSVGKALGLDEERVRNLVQLRQQYYSLDQSANDEDGGNMHTVMPDLSARLVNAVEDSQLVEQLNSIMEFVLNELEIYVLNERFGRLDSVPKTRQEIGEIIGLSRERARQIEVAALEKLRVFLQDTRNGQDLSVVLGDRENVHEA